MSQDYSALSDVMTNRYLADLQYQQQRAYEQQVDSLNSLLRRLGSQKQSIAVPAKVKKIIAMIKGASSDNERRAAEAALSRLGYRLDRAGNAVKAGDA
jgi:hypothetical protein